MDQTEKATGRVGEEGEGFDRGPFVIRLWCGRLIGGEGGLVFAFAAAGAWGGNLQRRVSMGKVR